ncbi:MAG TPA: hypothetical protein PKV86_14415 [Syntrophobacteraceae bacterium]|nr:hypothetical protein [Syntrophobacteraceae bacterium]
MHTLIPPRSLIRRAMKYSGSNTAYAIGVLEGHLRIHKIPLRPHLEALYEVYLTEHFRSYRQSSYLEFEKRIQERQQHQKEEHL